MDASGRREIIHTKVFPFEERGGSPCPVLLNTDGMTTEEMKSAAREFSLETAFVGRARSPFAAASLRFFFPEREASMCIHGSIAAMTVLLERKLIPFSSPVWVETMERSVLVEFSQGLSRIIVSVEQQEPVFSSHVPPLMDVAEALRIPSNEIDLSSGPILSVSTSRSKLIIPVRDVACLHTMKPDFDRLWHLCEQYRLTGFYPFAMTGADVAEARQFPYRTGYLEDAATGVAAAALVSYVYRLPDVSDGWHRLRVIQGRAIQKPSMMQAACLITHGRVARVKVSGHADIISRPETESR